VLRAVLFDLDDTLFDHRHGAREALQAVRERHEVLAAVDFLELDRRHAEILESLHVRVLANEIALDAARHERFRRLFEGAGLAAEELEDGVLAQRAAAAYRAKYLQSWREVPGAKALLQAVKRRARVGIVSNNLTAEQYDKLQFCGFTNYLDAIVISEEAGAWKPDPTIFRVALERLGVAAEETVMIGDSWTADIAGARAAGVRAIWFNPAGLQRPDRWEDVGEIRSLEPVSSAMSVIFRGDDPVRQITLTP
jgi:HAD superfamily hydrolase (TIGR01549 family)